MLTAEQMPQAPRTAPRVRPTGSPTRAARAVSGSSVVPAPSPPRPPPQTPPLPTPSPTFGSLLDPGVPVPAGDQPGAGVDYLSHDFALDDIFPARRELGRWCASDAVLRVRLENVLWRAWGIRAWRLQKEDPRELNWHKDADTGFLYGPIPRASTPGPAPYSTLSRTVPPQRIVQTSQETPQTSMPPSPRRHRRRTSSAPATVFPLVRPLAPILKPQTPRTLWDLLITSVAHGDFETRERLVSLVGQAKREKGKRKKDRWDRHDSGTVLESSSSSGEDENSPTGDNLSPIENPRAILPPPSRPGAASDRPPLLHPIPRLNLVIDLSLPHHVTLDTPTRSLSRAGKKSVGFVEQVEQAVIVSEESEVEDELDEEDYDDAGTKPPKKPPKPMTRRIEPSRLSGEQGERPPPPEPPKAKKSLASSLISAPIPGREQIDNVVDRGIDIWENVKELGAWLGIVVVAGAFSRVS